MYLNMALHHRIIKDFQLGAIQKHEYHRRTIPVMLLKLDDGHPVQYDVIGIGCYYDYRCTRLSPSIANTIIDVTTSGKKKLKSALSILKDEHKD